MLQDLNNLNILQFCEPFFVHNRPAQLVFSIALNKCIFAIKMDIADF